MQKVILGITLAAATVTAGFGLHHAARLKEELGALRDQQAPLASEVAQLERQHADDQKQIAALLAEKAGQDPGELQEMRDETKRLRSEVAQLQSEANLPGVKSAMSIAAKVNLLKQAAAQMPDKQVPEFQFLTAKDWADVASNFDLNTEDDDREAMSQLRQKAEDTFLNTMMKGAFKKYLAENNNILPADLSQLKPYFDVPVTDEMLQRYQLLQSGTVDPSADLVKLAVQVDPEYDSTHGMSINGAWGSWFNLVQSTVQSAANAFAADHNGQMPTDSSQVMSYLKQPMDPVTVQKYLSKMGH